MFYINIYNLYLLGATAAVTASGFFVDANGNWLGRFSGVIPQGNGSNPPQTLAGLFGAPIPPNSAGVWIILSGNVRFVVGTGQSMITDFTTYYAQYPQQIAGPDYNAFGRVAG